MKQTIGILTTLAFTAGFALGRAPQGDVWGWVVALVAIAVFLTFFFRATRDQ